MDNMVTARSLCSHFTVAVTTWSLRGYNALFLKDPHTSLAQETKSFLQKNMAEARANIIQYLTVELLRPTHS